MAIPNPNPNIRDLETVDNYTWSSNKIASEIANSSDTIKNLIKNLYYKKGDTITSTTTIQCAARITNAGDKVLLTYPLSKPIDASVTSATLNITTGNLAYVATSNLAISGGTYTGTIIDGCINFLVDLATTTTTYKASIANAILSDRTITFS